MSGINVEGQQNREALLENHSHQQNQGNYFNQKDQLYLYRYIVRVFTLRIVLSP